VASLSQGRTAAAQCGLFTYKSVPVIFEPPCIITYRTSLLNVTCFPYRHCFSVWKDQQKKICCSLPASKKFYF